MNCIVWGLFYFLFLARLVSVFWPLVASLTLWSLLQFYHIWIIPDTLRHQINSVLRNDMWWICVRIEIRI